MTFEGFRQVTLRNSELGHIVAGKYRSKSRFRTLCGKVRAWSTSGVVDQGGAVPPWCERCHEISVGRIRKRNTDARDQLPPSPLAGSKT
jgi:hypothetical protein